MKGRGAGGFVTLHASANPLLAKVAGELPPAFLDQFNAIDGFHIDAVADADFGNEQCAEKM